MSRAPRSKIISWRRLTPEERSALGGVYHPRMALLSLVCGHFVLRQFNGVTDKRRDANCTTCRDEDLELAAIRRQQRYAWRER